MIEIKDLSLSKLKKKKRIDILQNISLEIELGKITLFLGKSGSGKTSILRCISQIETKYHGEIFFEGRSIEKMEQKERCQLIGFVPQSYALFPFMTVLENCVHPLTKVMKLSKKEAYLKVEEAVCSLEMQNLLHSYPHELSGGQQQRTSILRALLLNPRFLLLDEPTSALDPENTDLLIQILHRLKGEGKGIIISSQDMHFSQKVCEDVFFMEHGRVIEQHSLNVKNEISLSQTKLGQFLSLEKLLKHSSAQPVSSCPNCKCDLSLQKV